ncbi:MAG: DUF397 domain-containing protein [Actinomycetota bacterium]|nr:DUF397 domain-containing protein [Actinomycetota bacterium]
MNPPDFTHAAWRKSTWSGDNGGQCVELAFLDKAVGLRDSKNKGSGPVLVFTAGAWKAFIAGAVEGTFGRV